MHFFHHKSKKYLDNMSLAESSERTNEREAALLDAVIVDMSDNFVFSK